MSGLALVFVALPSLGGALAGWLLTDWRLAGALAAGAGALLFVLPSTGWFTFVLPVIGGLALGALGVLALLKLREDPSVWSRATVGTAAAFFVSYFHLLTLG